MIAVKDEIAARIEEACELAQQRIAIRQSNLDMSERKCMANCMAQIPEWLVSRVVSVTKDFSHRWIRIDLPQLTLRLTATCKSIDPNVPVEYEWNYWGAGAWRLAWSCEEAIANAVKNGAEPMGNDPF